ncbi:MAG: DEAD/DEAH box helicase [Rhodopila sp.]|nr:DEAD/DEAH box helicase [Rhodopila sp.]
MTEVRDYQKQLVKLALDALARHKSPVIQLATGAGKTVIAADIIRNYERGGYRVWFVCHRREILEQTKGTLEAFGLDVGLVASGKKYDPAPLVHVCSIGALPHRASKIQPPRLIIWDECHHMASPSWSALHQMFPDAYHIGLSATPQRLDGLGLDDWFDEIIQGPAPRDLIDGGYLSSFRVFAPTIPDMRGVHERKGDYLRSDVAKAMDKPTLVGDVVEHYQRITPGKTALVFAVSIEASKNVVERFTAAGISALHVDADTPPDERLAAVEALRERRVQVLSNVELFTEGFDCPAIDALILLRPTKSMTLFRQMIGRGLRTADGKEPTVILDHAGAIHEHGMPDEPIEWRLSGPAMRGVPTGEARLRRCSECSGVHMWARECPECGHVYREDERSIEEVYGELREINPPLGEWETALDFSIRMKCPLEAVFAARRVRRMPVWPNGTIKIPDAIGWWTENYRMGKVRAKRYRNGVPEPGCEDVQEFAERTGLGKTGVKRKIKRGMPTNNQGYVIVDKAVEWLRLNPSGKSDSGIYARDGFSTLREFGALIGRSYDEVFVLVSRRGLPVIDKIYIHTETGLAWMETFNATRARKKAA